MSQRDSTQVKHKCQQKNGKPASILRPVTGLWP